MCIDFLKDCFTLNMATGFLRFLNGEGDDIKTQCEGKNQMICVIVKSW